MAPDFTDSDREPDDTDGSNRMPGASQDGPSGPVDGALDVIDRSIGMYVLRRLTGRSSKAASESDAPVALSAEQIAQRIGIAGAAMVPGPGTSEPSDAPPPVVAGTAVPTAAAARTTAVQRIQPRSQGSAAAVGPELDRLTRGPTTTVAAATRAAPAPRERLVRDSGVALLALAVVGLAVAMWPQGGGTEEPAGSVFVVDRAVVTPDPSDDGEAPTDTAAPTGEVAVETDVPVSTPEATTAPQDTPKPPAIVKPATQSTPRPGATPTRRPSPTPTAKPTASPVSTPTPDPPTPTPDPPTPTPDPPTPTPDPPTPTPDPPTPTPSP